METNFERKFHVTELTMEDQLRINGGLSAEGPSTKTSFWQDVGYVVGLTVKACIIFSREGGRNAGLCVR